MLSVVKGAHDFVISPSPALSRWTRLPPADRLKGWVAGSSPAREKLYGHSGMAEFRQGFLNPGALLG